MRGGSFEPNTEQVRRKYNGSIDSNNKYGVISYFTNVDVLNISIRKNFGEGEKNLLRKNKPYFIFR
ncbi:hypothetical protein C0T31_03320 [Dysgonamonadaceae bacterium]|nr:hypothetical protein C0T31_03320 [Dysgonamonadaceae bacterium]